MHSKLAQSEAAHGKLYRLQPIRLDINGIEETLLYLELEENIPADMARAKAMQHFSPIHSFMFDAHGELLHANEIAARKLLTDGKVWA